MKESTSPMDTPEENAGKSFEELFNEGFILNSIKNNLKYESPTPIQQAVIPDIFEGHDVYAGAKTGSGKTMAFLAPVAQMLIDNKIKKALVLCPTRELALQIDEEAMRLLEGHENLVSVPLYGGVPLDQQLRAMQTHNPRLYLATPGRVIDFIQEECLPLADIEAVVLDEADRMCDMGFSEQVEDILKALPNIKQTLMFSATLPTKANVIMNNFLKNPKKFQLDDPGQSSSTITHKAVFVTKHERMSKLREFIETPNQTIVVFARTRKQADRLYEDLSKKYDKIGILHAGFSMNDREKTIKKFRDGKIEFLVATDVAARGLDVERVTKVIHFEVPEKSEDYIHRSGRSGRAGRAGETIAFIDSESFSQRRLFQDLQKTINFEIEGTEPEMSGRSKSSRGRSEAKGNRGRRNNNNKRGGRSGGTRTESASKEGDRSRDSNSSKNKGSKKKRSSRSRDDRNADSRKSSSRSSKQKRGERRDPKKSTDESDSKKRSGPKKNDSIVNSAKKFLGGLFGGGKSSRQPKK